MLIHHVKPFAVPHLAGVWPQRVRAMFLKPFVQFESEVLLTPKHPGHRLSHDEGFIFADTLRRDALIKLVRLTPAGLHGFSEIHERIAHDIGRQFA